MLRPQYLPESPQSGGCLETGNWLISAWSYKIANCALPIPTHKSWQLINVSS